MGLSQERGYASGPENVFHKYLELPICREDCSRYQKQAKVNLNICTAPRIAYTNCSAVNLERLQAAPLPTG